MLSHSNYYAKQNKYVPYNLSVHSQLIMQISGTMDNTAHVQSGSRQVIILYTDHASSCLQSNLPTTIAYDH